MTEPQRHLVEQMAVVDAALAKDGVAPESGPLKPDAPEAAPNVEAEVDRILELVSAWRDADWAFEHEPYNVDAPSEQSCRLRDQRLAALLELTVALRRLIGRAAPLSDAERAERERLARVALYNGSEHPDDPEWLAHYAAPWAHPAPGSSTAEWE